MRLRRAALPPLALVLAAPALFGAEAAPTASLEVRFENLRSHKGVLQLCLTRRAEHFPDCTGDPAAFKQSLAASADGATFKGLAAGRYAVALVHDENGNGKLDKMLGIPREGFGFSRNPPLRFGAPKFAEAGFDIGSGAARQVVRVRYLL